MVKEWRTGETMNSIDMDEVAENWAHKLGEQDHYDPRYSENDMVASDWKSHLPYVVTKPENLRQYYKDFDNLYGYLKEIKQDKSLNSVQKHHIILKKAAQLSGGDKDKFMMLTSDLFFPKGQTDGFTKMGLYNRTDHEHKLIDLGSDGLPIKYNDASANQVSHHYHGLLLVGYLHGTVKGDIINVGHEVVEPKLFPGSVGSAQDYKLSVQAIRLGSKFKNTNMTMDAFITKSNKILNGQFAYPDTTDSKLKKAIPKNWK